MSLVTFFLSYRWEHCILKNWDRFDLQGLKKTLLVFLCDPAWPRYPLEDGKWWPVGGDNTVSQVDRFCRKQMEMGGSSIYVVLFLSAKYARFMS